MVERNIESSTVLIVEDDSYHAEFLTSALSECGISKDRVLHAPSDLTAWEILESQSTLPNIILLNLHLGRADGLSFLIVLKKHERFKEIPVVVVTASISATKELCQDHGAEDFISKPYEINELTGRVLDILSRGNNGVKL